MNNYNDLKTIIARELNCKVADVSDNAGWNKSLNWDSLTHIGIITAVELHFSIQIENSKIHDLKDFNSILQYIDNKK